MRRLATYAQRSMRAVPDNRWLDPLVARLLRLPDRTALQRLFLFDCSSTDAWCWGDGEERKAAVADSAAATNDHALPTAVLIGELLYTLRPLIYLCAVLRYGSGQWRPWAASLVVDALSCLLGLRRAQPTSRVGAMPAARDLDLDRFPRPAELAELRRRVAAFAMYLVRSPFYELLPRYAVRGRRP